METKRLPLFALLCASLLAFSSCEEANDEGTAGGDGSGAVSGEASSYIEATIKSVSSPARNFLKSEFASSDAISISASSSSATLFGSVKFDYDGTKWLYDNTSKFEMSASNGTYTFSALYPVPDSNDTVVNYDISKSSSPILFASISASSSNESVKLLFVHKLAELVMVFSSEDVPVEDEITFESKMIHTLSIDRVTGDVSYGDAETSQVTMYRSADYPSRYHATIVPQTISSYSITKDGVQYFSNDLSKSITLSAGGSLSYTPVLEAYVYGTEINGVIVDTEEWGEGNTGDFELSQSGSDQQ